MDAFSCIQQRTNLQLEDPLLTELHQNLVHNGDFDAAEDLVTRAYERGMFLEYVAECNYKPQWRKVVPDADMDTPSMRGGHQMCIDVDYGLVYLFGGWDGQKDLSDFWCYNENTRLWNCLSMDTKK
jgi:hypothetical protein